MCSELTPCARIPDTRIPQLMQPWWHTDERTNEQWKVVQYSVWAESAIICHWQEQWFYSSGRVIDAWKFNKQRWISLFCSQFWPGLWEGTFLVLHLGKGHCHALKAVGKIFMYENFDGAHLLARTVAMGVSGWPLLTRKWILTQYMMKSNISDSFFLKKFHIKTKMYNMILFQIGGWRSRFLFASPLFPGFPWRWMAPPFCCQCVEFVKRSLSKIVFEGFPTPSALLKHHH